MIEYILNKTQGNEMKLFSKDIIFIVKDNKLGSYYLDLGYLKESAEAGFSMQSSDNFVSVRIFSNSKSMFKYLKQFQNEEFNLSMTVHPDVSDYILDKYLKDSKL